MNIGVVGGGSVGLLLSSYLALNHNITVYVRREEQKKAINHSGILLAHSEMPISVNCLLIEELKKEDCIVICVKQTGVASVIKYLCQENEDTPLLFLQNGMGHLDLVNKMKQPVFLGTVEHGALKIDDRTVKHSGIGNIKLAPYNQDPENSEELSRQLHQGNFPVFPTEDWWGLLAEKLVINAVINPLTAMFDCKNGEILKNNYILKLAEKLCRETSQILGLNEKEQWERVKKVAEKTGSNYSSMCTDIKRNRKTEIEAISGYLLKNSEKKATPFTVFVYYSIKALEVKKGIIE